MGWRGELDGLCVQARSACSLETRARCRGVQARSQRAAPGFSPPEVTTERRGREILSSQVLADHPLFLSVFWVVVPIPRLACRPYVRGRHLG